MQVLQHIDGSLPVLKTTDRAEAAMLQFEDAGVMHLPVLNEEKGFVGMLSRQVLDALPNEQARLGDLQCMDPSLSVSSDETIFKAVRIMVEAELTVLPVIDKEELVGVLTPLALLTALSEFSQFSDPGGVFTLVVPQGDYSLSEISRIIESNHASILGVQVASKQDIQAVLVTVHVNVMDLTYILASFERYEYVIRDVFHSGEQKSVAQEHYELLMRYIDI